MKSYLNQKIAKGKSNTDGDGLFARENIAKGEVIADYSKGLGKYITGKEADLLYDQGLDHMIQVDEDLFFAATDRSEFETADIINHSCNPNCGIKGKLVIVAMQDISPSEEITFDYAMSESSEYEFDCHCGSANCRKVVTGNDWKIQELQNRYNGYFSEYLTKRINVQ